MIFSSGIIRSFATRAFGMGRSLAARRFEGAGGHSRWPDAPASVPLNSTALQSAHRLSARARYAYRNNPLICKGVDALADAICGTGIKPQVQLVDQQARHDFNTAWEAWTDDADITAVGDWYALTSSMVRAMIIDGESFLILTSDQDTGALRCQLLSADQIDRSLTRDLGNGLRIISGVEINAAGKPLAYHVLPDDMSLPFVGNLAPVRIEAEHIIHLFRRDFPGQVRGVSWLASILLTASDLDKTADANQMRLKVAALFAGFITDQEGGAAGMEKSDLDGGLEPGVLKVLRSGQSIVFPNMPSVGADVINFMEMQQRSVAAGLGVTYAQMTGDFSKSNYSSTRAALIEFRRTVESTQYGIIVFQLCRPIWRRWVTLEVLSGRLPAPGFPSDVYLRPRWITPGFQWVDPAKEIAAQEKAVEAGFMSRREVVAGRGLDIEEVDADRKADAERNNNTQEEAA